MSLDLKAALAEAVEERERIFERLPELDRIIAGLQIACGKAPVPSETVRGGHIPLRIALTGLAALGRPFTLADACDRGRVVSGVGDKTHVCRVLTELVESGVVLRHGRGQYSPADTNGHARADDREEVAV